MFVILSIILKGCYVLLNIGLELPVVAGRRGSLRVVVGLVAKALAHVCPHVIGGLDGLDRFKRQLGRRDEFARLVASPPPYQICRVEQKNSCLVFGSFPSLVVQPV